MSFNQLVDLLYRKECSDVDSSPAKDVSWTQVLIFQDSNSNSDPRDSDLKPVGLGLSWHEPLDYITGLSFPAAPRFFRHTNGQHELGQGEWGTNLFPLRAVCVMGDQHGQHVCQSDGTAVVALVQQVAKYQQRLFRLTARVRPAHSARPHTSVSKLADRQNVNLYSASMPKKPLTEKNVLRKIVQIDGVNRITQMSR